MVSCISGDNTVEHAWLHQEDGGGLYDTTKRVPPAVVENVDNYKLGVRRSLDWSDYSDALWSSQEGSIF